MIRFSNPFQKLKTQAGEARRRIVAERPQLMRRVGEEIQTQAGETFEALSQGQPSVGITWEAPPEGYVRSKRRRGLSDKIGIATGRLQASGGTRTGPDGVEFSYAAPYAAAFALARPLLPETMPKTWQDGMERQAVEWSDDILTQSFR